MNKPHCDRCDKVIEKNDVPSTTHDIGYKVFAPGARSECTGARRRRAIRWIRRRLAGVGAVQGVLRARVG